MRKLLADRHIRVLWALKTTIQEEPDIEIIGEAMDAERLLKLVNEGNTDLVFLDQELPGIPLEELHYHLHTLNPRLIEIVISNDPISCRRMLLTGADAWIRKEEQPTRLLEMLRRYEERV